MPSFLWQAAPDSHCTVRVISAAWGDRGFRYAGTLVLSGSAHKLEKSVLRGGCSKTPRRVENRAETSCIEPYPPLRFGRGQAAKVNPERRVLREAAPPAAKPGARQQSTRRGSSWPASWVGPPCSQRPCRRRRSSAPCRSPATGRASGDRPAPPAGRPARWCSGTRPGQSR